MSQEAGSSESGVRRSIRSTAGNRLREMIRLELKRKQNERFLRETFEGMQPGDDRGGMELLISECNPVADIEDESEYSTEASSDDIIDSDFEDFASDEGSNSGHELDLEPKSKRKRIGKHILTRSTSHPTKLVTTPTSSLTNISEVGTPKRKPNKSKESSKEKQECPSSPTEGTRRSKRNSTRMNTEEARQKHIIETKDKQERLKSVKPRKSSVKPLSQEELLKEAENTEILNTASLKSYLEMQIQRKKFVSRKKHAIHGPFIRYLSTSRPPSDSIRTRKQHALAGGINPTRVVNLIIHSHPEESPAVFRTYAPRRRTEGACQVLCPVTGLPAKYRDPLTKLPYHSADAFKTIRAKYAQQQEEKYLSRINALKNVLNGKAS